MFLLSLLLVGSYGRNSLVGFYSRTSLVGSYTLALWDAGGVEKWVGWGIGEMGGDWRELQQTSFGYMEGMHACS